MYSYSRHTTRCPSGCKAHIAINVGMEEINHPLLPSVGPAPGNPIAGLWWDRVERLCCQCLFRQPDQFTHVSFSSHAQSAMGGKGFHVLTFTLCAYCAPCRLPTCHSVIAWLGDARPMDTPSRCRGQAPALFGSVPSCFPGTHRSVSVGSRLNEPQQPIRNWFTHRIPEDVIGRGLVVVPDRQRRQRWGTRIAVSVRWASASSRRA
jgi:hypothetical protein